MTSGEAGAPAAVPRPLEVRALANLAGALWFRATSEAVVALNERRQVVAGPVQALLACSRRDEAQAPEHARLLNLCDTTAS